MFSIEIYLNLEYLLLLRWDLMLENKCNGLDEELSVSGILRIISHKTNNEGKESLTRVRIETNPGKTIERTIGMYIEDELDGKRVCYSVRTRRISTPKADGSGILIDRTTTETLEPLDDEGLPTYKSVKSVTEYP